MHKLFLLLKVQLSEAFRGRSGKKREKKNSSTTYTVVMAISVCIIVGVVTAAFIGMAQALAPLGLLHILPSIAMAGGCVFCLFTTIYLTNGTLFCFRDYDLVMALPIKTSIVVASRIIILYIWNMMFLLAIMVPACVVYGVFADPPFAFYILYVIGMLLAPLLPSILATIIGSLIALASSHFQKKSYMSTVFTLLFLVVWMLFVFNMDTVIEGFSSLGPVLNNVITTVYPPSDWFTQGVCDLNIGLFLLYVGVSIGAFVGFCAVVGHWFRNINSSLTADRTSSNFQMGALKAAGARKALLRKEFKRLTGSSSYFMNACIAPIMAVVFSAVILISGGSMLGSLGELSDFLSNDTMCLGVALFMCFFMALTTTSACSISLEGKNLWILRSSPVSGKEVLQAKLMLNFLLILVSSIISGILLCLAFMPSLGAGILIFASLIAFGTFSTVYGQWLNLKYPNFDWVDETKVVKRDKPVMLVTLVGMVVALVSMGLEFACGIWVAVIVVIALFIISFLLYRVLMTKGAARFESFSL